MRGHELPGEAEMKAIVTGAGLRLLRLENRENRYVMLADKLAAIGH